MHHYIISILAVSWALYLFDTYLSWRQYKIYKNVQKCPKELEKHIDNTTFQKSRDYSIDKAHFHFISDLYAELQSSAILLFVLLPFFWQISKDIMTSTFIGASLSNRSTIEWEILQSIIFLMITSLTSTFFSLPESIYSAFYLEERHGFNRMTAMFFVKDKCKEFLVTTIIYVPIIAATVYIVRKGGPYFFLYLWVFIFVVICILAFFSGDIAALFDKHIPLPEGDLRNKIQKLADGLDFPLGNIFVVEGSKRSAHSNAYQTGIFTKKRIVIYDTLIGGYYDGKDKKEAATENEDNKDKSKEDKKKLKKGCSTSEILAVLCHELGHWACSHLWKSLALAQMNFLLIFLIFSRFYTDPEFYAAFGFTNEMPVIIGLTLVMMLLTPYNALMGFLSTYLTRCHEYEADEFAAKQGRADKLISALIKLDKDNLGFPVHDSCYSMLKHSHPTLLQRIAFLKKYK